jgi:hypothetical protein
MIIYGWRSTVREGQHLRQPCSACEQTALRVVSEDRYAHVYWIPLFSVGRKRHVVCEQCGETLSGRSIPADMRARIGQEGAAPSFPYHHFLGVGAVAIIALVAFVRGQIG